MNKDGDRHNFLASAANLGNCVSKSQNQGLIEKYVEEVVGNKDDLEKFIKDAKPQEIANFGNCVSKSKNQALINKYVEEVVGNKDDLEKFIKDAKPQHIANLGNCVSKSQNQGLIEKYATAVVGNDAILGQFIKDAKPQEIANFLTLLTKLDDENFEAVLFNLDKLSPGIWEIKINRNPLDRKDLEDFIKRSGDVAFDLFEGGNAIPGVMAKVAEVIRVVGKSETCPDLGNVQSPVSI